eukprot:COSAG02_NODE_6302_length_3669_cov_1.755742_1_plen_123_part_00
MNDDSWCTRMSAKSRVMGEALEVMIDRWHRHHPRDQMYESWRHHRTVSSFSIISDFTVSDRALAARTPRQHARRYASVCCERAIPPTSGRPGFGEGSLQPECNLAGGHPGFSNREPRFGSPN